MPPSLILFNAALVLTALFALGHFGGFLAARRAARRDPALSEVTRLMRAHTSPLAGFRPSLLDFREYFSASFSPLLLAVAALNFVALRHALDPAAALTALCIVNLALFAVLLLLSALHSVVQGVVSCAVIALLFLAALIAP